MLLIHPVRELVRSLPALLALFLAGRSQGGEQWSLLGVAAVVALSVVKWLTTRYRITPDQVQLRTGLLRRRVVATPADRVRTVDVTAHPLHRLLGLAKVEVGTGISDRKREGLVLDGLPADAARRLRAELLHRDASGLPTALDADWAAVPTPEPELELLRLDPRWVRYAPFTLSGVLTGLAIIGLGWRIISQSQVDPNRIGAVETANRHLRDTPVVLDIVQVTLAIAVFVSVLSVAGYALAFWNFRLTQHVQGGTLHVARGLITTRGTSIEMRRLRGVEMSEPLLLRLVGGARLLAVTTGLRVGRGAERGGTLLVPPAPAAEVVRVGSIVLAGEVAMTGPINALVCPLQQHGPAARRRRIIRSLVPTLVLLATAALLWRFADAPGWLPVVALVFVAVSVPLGLDRYAALGHRLAGPYLVSRFGSLVRRRVALEVDGIIGWNLRQTFLQRRVGLTTLAATTAAGRQHYRLSDLESGYAAVLAGQVTPELFDGLAD
jgi:putative membrane protein